MLLLNETVGVFIQFKSSPDSNEKAQQISDMPEENPDHDLHIKAVVIVIAVVTV